METEHVFFIESPIGAVEIKGTPEHITGINFFETSGLSSDKPHQILKICGNQLQEYFSGKRKKFTVPIKQSGTDFQLQVWNQLGKIPFGHLSSYEEIAVRLKDKKNARAVGSANGRNQISIIVPCHRVVGKNGDITGYAGGLWRKKWLIEHEQYYFMDFTLRK
jgi:methylated-DNA-[protein]-cysteine S-methyltransferase